ncbi:hypothetical protein B4N89_47285 [Embleya scabrispora]|uniref:Uncharacterized protein n=1 Tax=Embleya scabrispora TaxID=159449 RepID=A0A1T3NHT9_9ACTN|nr:hypothetical protein [Embleya scabrispora]OPC76416.1 hypothetical protein B4N89_47285 [Embleya scabrispora]
MTDWSRLHDFEGSADDIPVLLFAKLAPHNRERAWRALHGRLCRDESVCPASLAALPLLWEVAVGGSREDRGAAVFLAGEIVSAGRRIRCYDRVLDSHAARVAEMAVVADAHLADHAHQAHYVHLLCGLLALQGHLAWAWGLDDLTDAFLAVHCPHCGADVTIAVGDYGDYSAIRDWHRGDIDRRPLRPTVPGEMAPPGARLHAIAVRDGQASLARGLPYVFGTAQCPPCGRAFAIAPAFEKRVQSDGTPKLPGT